MLRVLKCKNVGTRSGEFLDSGRTKAKCEIKKRIPAQPMIPHFNKDGNLPLGVHLATEEEFLRRFATSSARRKWLGMRLSELLRLAESTGKLERVFVWGSFVSAKESPNDLDILLLMFPDFVLEDVPESAKIVFDYVRAKVRFNADVFWSKSSISDEVLGMWLEAYQTTREFKQRGIVEVQLL